MCSRGLKKLFVIDLGRTEYRSAWELQKRLVELRHESKIPDCLVLTEHEPVITMGRAYRGENLISSAEELKRKRVELFEIERGGDITFHGPGQLVAYPIIDLSNRGRDLHRYLRDLEMVVISTLNQFGIEAGIKPGMTGVWVNDHKLAAIGVAVSRWITYHGLALNVNTDLEYFKLINPCGITRFPVGSMSSVTGEAVDFARVAESLARNFSETFNYEVEKISDIDAILAQPAEA
jgi:lipoate-protein ligase B